jgi:hypothetical protein
VLFHPSGGCRRAFGFDGGDRAAMTWQLFRETEDYKSFIKNRSAWLRLSGLIPRRRLVKSRAAPAGLYIGLYIRHRFP